MSGKGDAETTRRDYKGPYTPHHPIPTIQRYREEKKDRLANSGHAAGSRPTEDNQTKFSHEADDAADAKRDQRPHNETEQSIESFQQEQEEAQHDEAEEGSDDEGDEQVAKDTSEAITGAKDAKQQRKQMKKKTKKEEKAEREVTDPVTHLPVQIHDFTRKELNDAPENEPPAGSESRSATGLPAQMKDRKQLREEHTEVKEAHRALQAQFPPPEFDLLRAQLTRIFERAIIVGLGGVFLVGLLTYTLIVAMGEYKPSGNWLWPAVATVCSSVSYTIIICVQKWTKIKIDHTWDDEVWEAERREGKQYAKAHHSETTQWLNSLLASIWPLVNPDLFTSVADTLEDVMQASLPKMVRMVSVEDIGQGSDSVRILGVRWLPTGAAAKTVSKDGKFKSEPDEKSTDRAVPGEGIIEQEAKKEDQDSDGNESAGDDSPEQQQNDENVAEGMEAESGDFVNLEIAFSYRRRGNAKGMRSRAKNAHLYLAFYLYAGIKFPVWVEVHGFVGIIRLRLQLTPDPPFVSLCTLTFLGQPKVDLSCVPLSKHALNIMDLPLISNFVQSSIDAGLSTLVAPRNLTVDLKEMLVGDDFKKDTTARGVLVVRIKRGFDFKEGDTGVFLIKDGSADPYVSVGWAKFGKPVWSTRVILNEMEPSWDETAFILITPEELNVDERLRVQLWDSDRTTADDDLGRIEVEIKKLMKDSRSNGKMWEREDGFKSLKKGERMPGKLCWEVGYFSKTKILDSQLAEQSDDPDIQTVDQLKKKVYEKSENKLQEAKRDESTEIEQQKQQDFKARQDELLIHSPPPDKYPTGILSIQIHEITGLELEAINKNRANKKENASDEAEEGEDLPSSYCTIILNHQKIFRTRTKPKNGKPFFNAGTERVIRDWKNAEVHIAVRDSRVREDDPLLGMVYLPLGRMLSSRSQFSETFPLSGGMGFGRARISVVFRSIKLQAPRQLLGWEFGTIEIDSDIKYSEDLADDLRKARLKFRTSVGKAKALPQDQGLWKPKNEKPIRIAVRKRYSSALVIEFRSDHAVKNRTAAFAVLWLKDVIDNEGQTLKLPVWNGSSDLKRAETCCLEEYGEKAGHIEFKLTFWSGLSGYHAKLAEKDSNLGDVMEVLDAACDNDEMDVNFDGDETDSEGSSTDNDEHTPTSSDADLSENGKRGLIDAVKDYKHNHKELHRRNRGLMQWRGIRTAKWTEGKIKDGRHALSSLFKHHERDSGIETEV